MTEVSHEQIGQMFDLSGKVALITGGAVGMGKAAGLIMAQAGATVILADDADRIAEHAQEVPAGIEKLELDVKSEAAINALVADVIVRHGGIDILVNGAVVNHNKSLFEIDGDEWDHVHAINHKAAFLMAKAVIPSMQSRGGGRIINVTTIGSMHPVLNGNTVYGPSRAGLNHLTRNLAMEFAADHITANAVLPGAIMTETIPQGPRPTGPGANPERQIGGFGTPQDLAALILLLAGPGGRYITGQAIAVDGGFLVS